MAKYEVWEKKDISASKGKARSDHYTLDTAMDKAKELSKGEIESEVYDWEKNTSTIVKLPFAFAVIERAAQSRTRGWGIGGKWYDARDCKRCGDSGMDAQNWKEYCYACKGASFKPKI